MEKIEAIKKAEGNNQQSNDEELALIKQKIEEQTKKAEVLKAQGQLEEAEVLFKQIEVLKKRIK